MIGMIPIYDFFILRKAGYTMKFKVLVTEYIDPSGIDFLKSKGCEILYQEKWQPNEIMEKIADCQALIVRIAKITPEIIDAAKQLIVIGKLGVGVDNIDTEYAAKKGVQVVNAPVATTNSVAEHILLSMLYCAREVGIIQKEFCEKGNFYVKDQRQEAIELEGKTLGLLGCGKIARAAARKAAQGFGMQVIAYSPSLRQEKLPKYIKAVPRDDVFRLADFVSVNLPATAATKGSIGREEFAWMKDTAFFINTARGSIVREQELIEALNEKQIAGAAVDVFAKEPPDHDNELLHLDNVLATPHSAAQTREARFRVSLQLAEEIYRALQKRKLKWPVNKLC